MQIVSRKRLQQQNANITSFDHKHTAKTQTRLFVFPPEVQEPETQPLNNKKTKRSHNKTI